MWATCAQLLETCGQLPNSSELPTGLNRSGHKYDSLWRAHTRTGNRSRALSGGIVCNILAAGGNINVLAGSDTARGGGRGKVRITTSSVGSGIPSGRDGSAGLSPAGPSLDNAAAQTTPAEDKTGGIETVAADTDAAADAAGAMPTDSPYLGWRFINALYSTRMMAVDLNHSLHRRAPQHGGRPAQVSHEAWIMAMQKVRCACLSDVGAPRTRAHARAAYTAHVCLSLLLLNACSPMR